MGGAGPLRGCSVGDGTDTHTQSAHTHVYNMRSTQHTRKHTFSLALLKSPWQIRVKQSTMTFSAGLIRTCHLLLERGTPGWRGSVPRHAPPQPGRVPSAPAAPSAPRMRARLPCGVHSTPGHFSPRLGMLRLISSSPRTLRGWTLSFALPSNHTTCHRS